MYDKIAQRHLSKGKENALRFALSGLSCMCAATGKKDLLDIYIAYTFSLLFPILR